LGLETVIWNYLQFDFNFSFWIFCQFNFNRTAADAGRSKIGAVEEADAGMKDANQAEKH
jgi:hypothetical protein